MKLERQDIVGHKIIQVHQTPWVTLDGFDVCRGFVTLDNGLTFEIISEDTDESHPLDSWEIVSDWIQVEFFPDCRGEEVAEVVASDYWPSIGLLLSSDFLLFICDEYPVPRVGLQISLLGEKYKEDEVRPYWKSGFAEET